MRKFIAKIQKLIKAEPVLLISALAAAITMFLIPPSLNYLSYLDLRVLSLLFCLMAVIAGFNETGVFGVLSGSLLKRVKNMRSLGFVLIMLCFFSAMFITNDVALITFVPFTIMILSITGQKKYLIRIIVLQTIAANLGSMLTPVGNPQNLYLYSAYDIPIKEFLKITFPYTAASFFLISITAFMIRREPLKFVLPGKESNGRKNNCRIAIYGGLFLVCLICVLHLLDYRCTLIIVLAGIFLSDRRVLKKVDYTLLLTFVCFFLFVGNIQNISAVRDCLADLLKGLELPAAVAASQLISNVPAAILLSAFTDDYKAILLGTDIGGLGTLVASLASLISYKFYCRTENAKPGKYLYVFTGYNLAFLILLCVLYYWGNV